jgi:hypothetical protein
MLTAEDGPLGAGRLATGGLIGAGPATGSWAIVIPPLAWAGGLGTALLIGAAARAAARPPRRPHVPTPARWILQRAGAVP